MLTAQAVVKVGQIRFHLLDRPSGAMMHDGKDFSREEAKQKMIESAAEDAEMDLSLAQAELMDPP